jgi:hypothetical protein
MDNGMPVLRHVPDVRVLSTQQTAPGPWRLRVESAAEGTRCCRGGREICALHGWEAVVRRGHRPVCAVPVCIALRPTRDCGSSGAGHPTTTHRCAWYEPRRPPTKAYEP